MRLNFFKKEKGTGFEGGWKTHLPLVLMEADRAARREVKLAIGKPSTVFS